MASLILRRNMAQLQFLLGAATSLPSAGIEMTTVDIVQVINEIKFK